VQSLARQEKEGPPEQDRDVEEMLERARKFEGHAGHKRDDYRDPEAAKAGGFQLMDAQIQSRLRSAGKEILK